MPDLSPTPPPAESSSKWRPLSAIERRILGVLIEKGKTTPDQYPLSLNALVTASNQKTNRYPQMEIEVDDLTMPLERLRSLGAVAEVQGSSRVPRYRHFAYEWLGVNKVELAVMAELLLRGTQTEGDLRGRAARMEPIADVAALRPVLEALKEKNLVLSLSPIGRGHTVTHNLYQPHELEKQQTQFAQTGEESESTPHGSSMQHVVTHHSGETTGQGATSARPESKPIASPVQAGVPVAGATSLAKEVTREVESLRQEVESLRSEVRQLRSDLAELTAHQEKTTSQIRELRDSLGG
ncbi:MAG: DUF480 domain-containing protein [Planctomycetota bacterium]|nr:DUF480 domain-containing protein [Planctomycetota bacterium]